MKAYLFPGQGSQVKGMGQGLFKIYPNLTDKADATLGYSIRELCLSDPDKQLSQTQYAQPALYVVNALMYFRKMEKSGRKPEFLAGYSLGEYNALLAADVFDFETGLKIVKKRGELYGHAENRAMAAIVGMKESELRRVLEDNGQSEIENANYNTPQQFVISGCKDDLIKADRLFKKRKLNVPLKVSGAFYSCYMREAASAFETFIAKIDFQPLRIPVISNLKASPYRQKEIKRILRDQITNPVKWTESICYLIGQGVKVFEEIGPGRILTGLLKNIRKEARPQVLERHAPQRQVVKKRNAGARLFKTFKIAPEALGSADYRKTYGVRYAYAAGGMFRGISSEEMVCRMANARIMSYFGTGGLTLERIEAGIRTIQAKIAPDKPYGVNLVASYDDHGAEDRVINLILKYQVKNIEAAAYFKMSPGLVRFRLKGLKKRPDGTIQIEHRIKAKLSRPEIAEIFLAPAPGRIISRLLSEGSITSKEADLAGKVPMADNLCVEADSGGHTDQRSPYALMPVMLKLRDSFMAEYGYDEKVAVGAAGGIGTPEAVCAAFMMGAEFIVTGSINQCTPEAGTSNAVKEMLQCMNVQDTDYVPAGDMFEMGSKVQVLRKGLLFPARANRLFQLYQNHPSIDTINEKSRNQIQDQYFRKSFEDVYKEIIARHPEEAKKAGQNTKYKMALIFKWYFRKATSLALLGDTEQKMNYQIMCGPALGAFNQWVKGTELEKWENRHVDLIAHRLMREAAELMTTRFREYLMKGGASSSLSDTSQVENDGILCTI